MATNYKVLGQAAPGADTLTTLYTVPAATSAVCSTISVCNRGATASFRIAVRPAGASIANQHYIVYDNWVNASDTVFLTIGMTLATTDVVSIQSSANTLSFSLFGAEIS
jgi:hypothetical protein